MITIPLVNGAENAHQVFSVQLGDNFLTFTLNFVTRSLTDDNFAAWVVDIEREGELLIAGAPLSPGTNIVENYDLGIGRLVFVGDTPTLNNLGESNSLVWEDE